MAAVECGGFLFYSDFDSGNLSKVEWVPRNESSVVPIMKNGKEIIPEIPDLEFNIWTKPDCLGTEFENGNRTWFYFGIKGYLPFVLVKINMVDLNRQAKMYSQGMAPVCRQVPGKAHWERVRDKPTYTIVDNIFTLSFKYRTPENCDTVTYFAFTYPYSYTDMQNSLISVDSKFLTRTTLPNYDDIYYCRECIIKSLEGRRMDLITISSYYNISTEREDRLKNLFPDISAQRPFKFVNKKVIYISARVHPGETPSSFVFNGFLNLLLNRDDPISIILRRIYVFKLIPCLNPDGVARGHYRTDTRGVNLNRVYLNPSLNDHPTIYAARALIRYYHYGFEKDEIIEEYQPPENDTKSSSSSVSNNDSNVSQQVEVLSLEEKQDLLKRNSEPWCSKWNGTCRNCSSPLHDELKNNGENVASEPITKTSSNIELCTDCLNSQKDSGLFLYVDMHGHASKKGIFMYGNHFEDVERSVECMLLPKLMAINNHNFHFTACNFTERNMYLKDRRDGMSREGAGRVAVLKLTGLVRSYTLECNYNTGRLVNVLPATIKENHIKTVHTLPTPPKYTPQVFEEVGKALGASILDLTGINPFTRIPNSEFRTLNGLEEWLRVNCLSEFGIARPARTRVPISNIQNKSNRCKAMKPSGLKPRPNSVKPAKRCASKSKIASVPVERKENVVYPSKDGNNHSQTPNSTITKVFTRSNSRTKGLLIRTRVKRESIQRGKSRPLIQEGSQNIHSAPVANIIQNRIKGTPSVTNPKCDSPKRLKVSEAFRKEGHTDRFIKLKEICFVKENLTKKVIAKFMSSETEPADAHDDDEDLVVAWDADLTPRVTTSNITKFSNYKPGEPSTSSKQSCRSNFKANAYAASKVKRPKGSLRRLTSATSEPMSKVDKMKKRKKIKSKNL